MTTTTDRLAIFLTGIGVGVAGAFLCAPNAGDETRRRLIKGANSLNEKGNQLVSDVKERVTGKIDDAACAAKQAAGQVLDKSRDVAHDAGRKIEEAGKKLQEV
jgi:gas vesicle protein